MNEEPAKSVPAEVVPEEHSLRTRLPQQGLTTHSYARPS